MKRREGRLTKFFKFRTKIDKEAREYFINSQPEEKRGLAKKFCRENEKEIKKELREEYLSANPIKKEQYEKWKKQIIAIAGIGMAATLGVGTIYNVANNNREFQEEPIKVEQEKLLEDEIIQTEEKEVEENTYDEFFKEAREMKSTEKRDEFITKQTKQVIVEVYNKEHPENPITEDRLETLILNENILQKRDRLGNYTYERVEQNVQYEQNETQKLIKIGNVYDFRIDGQTVAVFDGNGSPLQDKNAKSQDMSFVRIIKLLNISQELKDIYKYPSNDYEKKEIENEYEQVIEQILENSNRNIEEQERE